MQTAVVRWPDQADERETLRRAGLPRLLVIPSGFPPPTPVDDLEDWVRDPVSESDLRARVEWLTRRVTLPTAPAGPPVLDADGLLSTDAGWVSLPPVDARIAQALLERFGAVVSRDALARAGWPEGAPGRNALDVHVLRMRRRLEPIGIRIRTVRSRGYLLEVTRVGT